MKINQQLLVFTNLAQQEEATLSGGQVISAVGGAGRGRGTRGRVFGGAGVIISDLDDTVDSIGWFPKKLITKRLKARIKLKFKKPRF